jgi:hypothetical protein
LGYEHKLHNTVAQHTPQTQINNNTDRLDWDINCASAPHHSSHYTSIGQLDWDINPYLTTALLHHSSSTSPQLPRHLSSSIRCHSTSTPPTTRHPYHHPHSFGFSIFQKRKKTRKQIEAPLHSQPKMPNHHAKNA